MRILNRVIGFELGKVMIKYGNEQEYDWQDYWDDNVIDGDDEEEEDEGDDEDKNDLKDYGGNGAKEEKRK